MVNITDVAARAGVSHQTVSRVLNDEATVRPATRARVTEAIRALNYRPSAAARALATRRSRTIGLVATGAPLFGPSSTMLAFQEAARSAGYRVSIASMSTIDDVAMKDAVDGMLAQGIEALVVIVADEATFEAIAGIDLGIPLVAAESSGREGIHSVSIDQVGGARRAVRHLLDLGHRGILHLRGPYGSLDAAERERGWRDELHAAGLQPLDPLVGDWMPSSGFELGRRLISSGTVGPDAATAVFSANDQMALGLLHALSQAGLAVPADVSVVGFDDTPESEHFTPPLTTIRQDFRDLGSRLLAAVLTAIDGAVPTDPVRAPAPLVVRASTAAPVIET
ncbi:MAG: hypothetical protein RI885_1073 [Actinomycetota bacterium]